MRGALASALLLALAARAQPDLGTIRYHDPHERRALWLGVDVGGVYLPRSLGLFDRDVWMVHATPAWALALTPWLCAGGRHGLVWYDAQNIRLRLHLHEAALSALAGRGRWVLGVEAHTLETALVARADGKGFVDFPVGGVDDVIVHAGYGMEHTLGPEWSVGWMVDARYAWVFANTQRQGRASVRLSWAREPHALSVEGVGFLVHRDPRQAGRQLERTTVHAQAALEYAFALSRAAALVARLRGQSAFMSGEAPLYEVREESLESLFGELVLGARFVWD